MDRSATPVKYAFRISTELMRSFFDLGLDAYFVKMIFLASRGGVAAEKEALEVPSLLISHAAHLALTSGSSESLLLHKTQRERTRM